LGIKRNFKIKKEALALSFNQGFTYFQKMEIEGLLIDFLVNL